MGSGARYVDWSHIRVSGDRDAVAQYVPYARTLLGFVMDEARRNQLGVHKVERKLSDGTRVIAEKYGNIPRVTIIPVGQASEQPELPPDDFVVWARNELQPDGIDAEYPQQILRRSRGERWKTFFKASDIAGYDSFEYDKGTYGGTFPEGVKHAGNIDWKGRRGVRLNWYGPSTRYWYDPHVMPRHQYGTWVFCLGQVVLDTEQYLEDSPEDSFTEKWVMGAALRNGFLYVVQAELVVPVTDDSPAPADSSDISTPWPVGPVPLVLCRYALSAEDAVTYRVVPSSRGVLWSGTAQNALNPWMFNESVTAAVSMGLPDNVLVRRRVGDTVDAPHTMDAPLPSDTNPVFTLSESSSAWGLATTTVSLQPSGEPAVVAADFRGDELVQMTVRREAHGELTNRFVFKLGDLELPARQIVFGTIPWGETVRATYTGFQEHLLHADLREQALVTYRNDQYFVVNAPTGNVYTARVRLHRSGEMVAEPYLVGGGPVDPVVTGFARQLGVPSTTISTRYDAVYAAAALAPLFALYGHISQFQLQPIWDWTGAHGLYSFRAYPADMTFGAARLNSSWLSGVTRVDADADVASGEGDLLDTNGKVSVLGCATLDGTTALSLYGYSRSLGEGLGYERNTGESINYVDGATLEALTGVGDELARYRPIWLLGEPLREAT